MGPPKEDAAQDQAAAFVGYARGLHAAHLRLAAAAAAAAAADDPLGSGGSGDMGAGAYTRSHFRSTRAYSAPFRST